MRQLYALGMAAICVVAVLVEGFSERLSAGEAVSGLNGKMSALYGDVDGEDTAIAEASISMPLADQFGFQVDGLLGEIAPASIHGIGGHLFWRDSQLALLGLTGTWAEYDDIEVNRIGLEGEYYIDQFTFAATLGHQGGEIGGALYGGTEARFYPDGDLLLSAAWSRAESQDLYGVGTEWQTPISRLSVFAQLVVGDDDYEHAFGGVRFYLGGLKSLARHHREDDPASMLLQSLTANLRAAKAAARAQTDLAQNEGRGDLPSPGEVPGSNPPGGDSHAGDSHGGDSHAGDSQENESPEADSPEADGPEGDGPEGDGAEGGNPDGASPADGETESDSPQDDDQKDADETKERGRGRKKESKK